MRDGGCVLSYQTVLSQCHPLRPEFFGIHAAAPLLPEGHIRPISRLKVLSRMVPRLGVQFRKGEIHVHHMGLLELAPPVLHHLTSVILNDSERLDRLFHFR